MDFVAIDVETANPDYSTICQVGIAVFRSGELVDTWSSLVNPEDYFDPVNVALHGISEIHVESSPLFPDVLPYLLRYISDMTTVHHMPFDRVAISRAAAKYSLPNSDIRWLDTARVARRAWRQFARSGYGLCNLASGLGITFKHHDALEDAIAAGKILVQAIQDTGLGLDEWRTKAYMPISSAKAIKLEGNPNGPLYGENLVFTGTLSVPRRQAAEAAAKAGCNVSNTVNKRTTILVVGTQDIRRLKGSDKSAKQLKAEQLVEHGTEIRIISEDDLLAMIHM